VTWWKEEITWRTSAELAEEKGAFPAYDENFLKTNWFTKFTKISDETKVLIKKNGVRNGKTTTNPPLGNCQPLDALIQLKNESISFEKLFSKYDIPLDEEGWHIREDCSLEVLTMDGCKKITAFYVNGVSEINICKTGDGKVIKGTDNHKVLVKMNEKHAVWKKLKDIEKGDIIISLNNTTQ
jgi:hypothetical protein